LGGREKPKNLGKRNGPWGQKVDSHETTFPGACKTRLQEGKYKDSEKKRCGRDKNGRNTTQPG